MKLLLMTLVELLAIVGAVSADEKKDTPKPEAKGALTIGDKTHTFENALAYETKKGTNRRTVVILTEKPLDTAKLKLSFEKNGNDEDFFARVPHVKLSFDDRGGLVQTSIYADGGNIGRSGDPNVKATATIKDGSAKGKAGMLKPDEAFGKVFTFEVTFDVKLMTP